MLNWDPLAYLSERTLATDVKCFTVSAMHSDINTVTRVCLPKTRISRGDDKKGTKKSKAPASTEHAILHIPDETPGTPIRAKQNRPPKCGRESNKIVQLWNVKGRYVIGFVP
jgi:hypothetical protein